MTAKYFSGPPGLVEAAAVLKAMADPNRLRLLDLLSRRESCHAELKEEVGLPPNLLSHHLGVLREAGLVQTRPDTVDARWIYYRADPAALSRWRHWLDSFLAAGEPPAQPAGCGPEAQQAGLAPAEKAETRARRSVLFLCSGNSCRSQMAEAIANTRLKHQWEAVSAGTEPAKTVHPQAVAVLAEIGIDWQGHTSKEADLFRKVPFDLVVTLCDRARAHRPAWVKHSTHLGFPDPVQAEGSEEEVQTVFRDVRDEVARQIPTFLTEWARTHPRSR